MPFQIDYLLTLDYIPIADLKRVLYFKTPYDELTWLISSIRLLESFQADDLKSLLQFDTPYVQLAHLVQEEMKGEKQITEDNDEPVPVDGDMDFDESVASRAGWRLRSELRQRKRDIELELRCLQSPAFRYRGEANPAYVAELNALSAKIASFLANNSGEKEKTSPPKDGYALLRFKSVVDTFTFAAVPR